MRWDWVSTAAAWISMAVVVGISIYMSGKWSLLWFMLIPGLLALLKIQEDLPLEILSALRFSHDGRGRGHRDEEIGEIV